MHKHTHVFLEETLQKAILDLLSYKLQWALDGRRLHSPKTLRLKKDFGKQNTMKPRLRYGILGGGIFEFCFIIKYRPCTLSLVL